jgi:hypothetical protein
MEALKKTKLLRGRLLGARVRIRISQMNKIKNKKQKEENMNKKK